MQSTPSRGGDPPEAHVEAVCKGDRVAGLEVGGDVVVEDRFLLGVGGEDHDHVGPLGGIVERTHGETGILGLLLRR